MDRQQWLNERDSRSLRYSGRSLDPTRHIVVTGDAAYLGSYEGQVAALVACNLLSRMTPSVAIALPEVTVASPLPWAGERLAELVLHQMFAADPGGSFVRRDPQASDATLYLGANGPGLVAHGAGWNCYCGPGSSPLRMAPGPNPFGSGLSAILAVWRLFQFRFDPPPVPFICNALDWRESPAPPGASQPNLEDLGELWFVGAGSVGSAVMYFLTLATRNFRAGLFDMDIVKIHNLDRSPIFAAEEAERKIKKVHASEDYLRRVGVKDIFAEPFALHESPFWQGRQPGRPDVMISAANEKNVRHFIEEGFPPLQLYATTGKHWQTALIRHLPMEDPCSLCLFPNDSAHAETQCAFGKVSEDARADVEQVDAALPFLSFAAGLMTAAEITKLAHSGYPYSANRVFLQARPELTVYPAWLSCREECLCQMRSKAVHKKMLVGNRYLSLNEKGK